MTNGPVLQRLGVRYFETRSAKVAPVSSVDAVHIINDDERRAMRTVVRGAIIRAAIAGAISGGLSAAAEVIASPLLPEGSSVFSRAGFEYWGLLGSVTLVASAAEILFLYWDTLRSVHELARVAGLELFGANRAQSDTALANALARAALELPNPIDLDARVNPHREASRWRLLAASLAYKAKVGVTNFLVKMLVRRLLGRVAVRGVLGALVPFVALPVTAAWNGVVMWLILREARFRAMGPSAVDEFIGRVSKQAASLTPAGRLAAVRAVASAIVRTQDFHPNLVYLFTAVSRLLPVESAELDDVTAFLRSLPTLDEAERAFVFELLAIACIIDGRLTAREKQLWVEARVNAGLPTELESVERLRRAFTRGSALI